MSTLLTVDRPDNVPPELVVDFDYAAQAGKADDVQLAFSQALHGGPDIVWTPHHGGHWIATRAADIDVMQLDHEHFSHRHFNIPRNDYDQTALPLGLDPPEHTPFRRMIMPVFMPKSIKVLEGVARQTARDLVAELAPKGHCEFIADFAKVLPINVFLGMVNLPFEHRDFLLEWAEIGVRSTDIALRMDVHMKMREYLSSYIDERMKNPGEDVLSMVCQGDVNGRPITRDEVISMSTLLLFGGLDTVASQLGFIAHFLARHPAHRHELVGNRGLHQMACEELLRRYGLPNTARVLTQDYEYKDIRFKAGDMIMMPKCLYGLDERVVSDPETVDFHRKPSSIKHAAFGAGPHTCPGAVLARREVMVFFDEWLPVIPDFELDPDDEVVMASGSVNGVLRLPLRWKV